MSKSPASTSPSSVLPWDPRTVETLIRLEASDRSAGSMAQTQPRQSGHANHSLQRARLHAIDLAFLEADLERRAFFDGLDMFEQVVVRCDCHAEAICSDDLHLNG